MPEYPPIDEFGRLPPAERRRILAEMRAETEQAAVDWRDLAGALQALGATDDEIRRAYRGDPTVLRQYGLGRGHQRDRRDPPPAPPASSSRPDQHANQHANQHVSLEGGRYGHPQQVP